jgi:hypothetical protein
MQKMMSRAIFACLISLNTQDAGATPITPQVGQAKADSASRVVHANEIALTFIETLPAEAKSSVGIRKSAGLAGLIDAGYTNQVEKNYEKLIAELQTRSEQYSHDPLLRKEVEVVINIAQHSLNLIQQNKKHGRLSIFMPFNYVSNYDGIDPLSYIFDGLSSLIQKQYPKEDFVARFTQYVKGYENLPPLLVGIERELKKLKQQYQSQNKAILYPSKRQLAKIIDSKNIASITKWIEEILPEQHRFLVKELQSQIVNYVTFIKTEILPYAPEESHLPEEIYRTLLQLNGVDAAPEELIQIARADFEKARQE